MTIAGEVIKICRLREKASRKELATMLGVSTQNIWAYEEGIHEPRFSLVYEALQMLGYEVIIRKKNSDGNNKIERFEEMENDENRGWRL